MDGGILNQGASRVPTFTWQASEATAYFSSGFLAVALLSAIGLAVGLGLSYGSPCTGIDLNARA